MADAGRIQTGVNQSNVVLADRFSNPGEMNFGPTANYTFAGICGILSLVLFLALLVMQWIEFTKLQEVCPH